jgi:hypothetical protein
VNKNVRMPDASVHRRCEELYALPPDEFTAARNALAKELKAAGEKDAAAEVSRLRRPSVGAWALNQVARQHLDLIEAALDAGAELRAASEAAAAGDAGDAAGLREATATERAAGQAVVKAARPHLGARADALAPALLSTLRVAALDETIADELRRGTLAAEHETAGFGFGVDGGDTVVAPRRTTGRAKAKTAAGKGGARAKPDLRVVPDPDPTVAAEAKAARAELRAAAQQRTKERAAAEKHAARLEREAERLAKEASVAEAAGAEARRVADDAMARAAQARRALDELGD